MFRKLLIANRGEIACRIIKTAKRMGIETVAVYSVADRNSLHVQLADEAYCLGEAPAKASYLNIQAIISAAQSSNADAIHPGYGFLSENPAFAKACQEAHITFVGPSIEAMQAMASKQWAKQQLESTNVPLTPGYHGKDQADKTLFEEAKRIGFPILLKAAAGGGGKGMRHVTDEAEFLEALAGARREALASFGDEVMIIEKLIQEPRHVELQILADNHGTVLHLYDRDCSIQRRHQKIIEEAPAPNLSNELRSQMAQAAIEAAKLIHYQGAGTVEFLVDKSGQFYFMEMNTRLQVEHPVTEMITGLDLVEWQLRIAANETLSFTQDEMTALGHAIECRIYAEDPRKDFMPSIGKITYLKEPLGEGIRIDTGVKAGSAISKFYDPMIAKIIAWGESREQALHRLQRALKHYSIVGVKTNISYLLSIIENESFIKAQLNTHFLSKNKLTTPSLSPELLVQFAAAADYANLQQHTTDPLQKATFGWQMHLNSHWQAHYDIEKTGYDVLINPINDHCFELQFANQTTTIWTKLESASVLEIDNGMQLYHLPVQYEPHSIQLYINSDIIEIKRFNHQLHETSEAMNGGQLTAPMPSTVVAILRNKGDKIKAGEKLMILEAMKMEHTITAPTEGRLLDIYYDVGAQVAEGAQLMALESLDK